METQHIAIFNGVCDGVSVQLFLEKLDLKTGYLASDHLTNYLWAGHNIIYRGVAGSLPEEKPAMLETVRNAIKAIQNSPFTVKDSNQLYREGVLAGL